MDRNLFIRRLIWWWLSLTQILVSITLTSADVAETQVRVCIGTNERMSVPSNRNQHYRNLRERFTNCTYVDGNLELTWLEDAKSDLSFLQHIREVTGYVLISHVNVKTLILARLQIIRGQTLFKLNALGEQFGLFVSYSQMETLELPALRDILAGSVSIFNNQNLCHIRSIDWVEIISSPEETFQFVNKLPYPERECPLCHPSCVAGCWGEGVHNCQKFSKVSCSPQCSLRHCFSPKPRDCCHSFCAGGCTGPTQEDCLACRNFNDEGVCKKECPPMQKFNTTNNLWEPNPDGKYAYGATCVRNCPEHLLKDNGACVRTCPSNKTPKNGECVPCNGPCPKTCPGVGLVNSGNIDSFRDCTIIEGSLEILDQSFNGYQQVYMNFSFGPRFSSMHPDRLEVFSTVREVTGYINILGNHNDFTNLSYLRNLEVIGGRELLDTHFASLFIKDTSLKSLELRSLKQINSGAVVITMNKNLCFIAEIDWSRVIKSGGKEPMTITENRNQQDCNRDGQICSDECTQSGCWGLGPNQCLECKHVNFDGTCLRSCDSQPNIYMINDKNCGKCHPECMSSCSGPNSDNCLKCAYVRDGKHCVAECPESKYLQNDVCVDCHEGCVSCTGPNNAFGPNGCIACKKAIITEYTIERCIQEKELCPDGYYSHSVKPQEQGLLKPFAGKSICLKCHPQCKHCTGYGFHEQVCQQCTNYKNGEQCRDECPIDHYSDEIDRECFPCHSECRGCVGSGPNNCKQCRNFKLYQSNTNANSTSFNCTAICPIEYLFKVFSFDSSDVYCSAELSASTLKSEAFFAKFDGNVTTTDLGVVSGIILLLFSVIVVALLRCQQKGKSKRGRANATGRTKDDFLELMG